MRVGFPVPLRGGAVAVVFVGVLLLFCFCTTIVETVLELYDDEDGTTTRGITIGTVANDGRFENWAVMGFENVRRGGP